MVGKGRNTDLLIDYESGAAGVLPLEPDLDRYPTRRPTCANRSRENTSEKIVGGRLGCDSYR